MADATFYYTGTRRCKVSLKKWGFLKDDDVNCVCGTEPQTMEHLLRCPLLEQTCNPEGLAEYNDVAKECVQLWQKHSI